MTLWQRTIVAVLVLAAGSLPARADIGLLLNAKSNDQWALGNSITGEGHAAVYLSRVCATSPVELRLCAPGENGSVIQNYVDYKEDQPYEWNVVPLNIYLYGVANAADRPLFGSPELRRLLQEQYRRSYLQDICTTAACITSSDANWRDAVAAALVREIYIFEVRTTVEQDEAFIRAFNARPNVNHYNGVRRNCADFAKLVVNTYFPHSVHRDLLNDFGMTGPKAISRSFSHYAEKRPGMDFHVIRIEQVPGTYKRSSDCHEGTEQTFRSKKWLVPMLVVGTHEEPVLAASYLLTGRFNPDHELRNWPSEEASQLHARLVVAKNDGDSALAAELKRDLRDQRIQDLGDEQQWEQYHNRFDEILHSAIDDGVVADRHELDGVFRQLQANADVYLDSDGRPWLRTGIAGEERRVGLSATDIFSDGSDRELALQLLLERVDAQLSAKANHRERWDDFLNDWAMLERAEHTQPAHGVRSVIASRAPRP